ncbi:hypothetical protein QFZ23_003970 [Arthrobacter globiformis]|uniref:hypothetical protein n=1 Tax=Arthrobacter globiformis TaxID=1665 RepID=UPI00278711C1|nr:hypothetical protein [Arthrobacter globiformis]MDQ1060069.1 hypothetical protein [Arthrobacter globiformis]
MSTPSDEPEPRDSGAVPPSGSERPTPEQQFPGQEPGRPTPGQQFSGQQPDQPYPTPPGQPTPEQQFLGQQPDQPYPTPPGQPTPEQQFLGQQPDQPGQPAPGQQFPGQQPPAGGGRFAFEMPADRPRNFSEVLPRGGFSGLFDVTGLPTELRVSYWIWVIGGLLGLLGGVIGIFGVLVLFAIIPGVAILVFLLVLVALAVAAAEIVLALKLKEGKEWARLALTIVAGVSLLLAIISSSFPAGQDGNWLGFLVSLVATALMWVPNSQNWFAAGRGRL